MKQAVRHVVILRLLIGLTTGLVCGRSPAQGAPAQPAAGRAPAVLFMNAGIDWASAGRLHQAGFNLNTFGDWQNLTWDKIKDYNAVVLVGLGESNADFTLTPINQANLEVLNRFLAAGGGIFYVPSWGQMNTQLPPQQAWAKTLGLTPLFDEVPVDAPTTKRATAWEIDFAHTTAIAPSAVTQDVHSLWYPVPASRIGGQTHTVPLAVDANWRVVIKGEPSSHTRVMPLDGSPPKDEGTCTASVPLLATRQVGPGRIVVLGIAPQYTFNQVAATTLENIVLERGLGGVASDGYKIIENALKWLTEPSLQNTPALGGATLGGAAMDDSLLQHPWKTKFSGAFDWSHAEQFLSPQHAYSGIVGARSTYSSGQATVEQWVQAARAKGLSYLVFLEDFKALSPAKFDKLKDDCARLSTPDFGAIPGFAIDDEVGYHYFYCGTSFPYPDKKFLSPDGKVFISRDPEVDAKNPYLKGQLSMTTLDYAYTTSAFRLTAGNYGFNDGTVPFPDFFSDWDATSVVTSRNGRLIEDATQAYLTLAASGQGPLPLAINFMDSPAQLDGAAWHTVLRLPENGGGIEGGRINAATKFADYWNMWHFYPNNPTNVYVTNGPSIDDWSFVGPRDYEGSNQGDYVWQNLRWRVHGKAQSAAGLREVAVYDGLDLFRRFLPQGRQSFEFMLDLTHDRQHSLVMIVTDTAGHRAISGDQWDRNHRLEEFMCSDRNNQLSYGFNTNSQGLSLMLGGNQSLATPFKRLDPKEISPSGTFRNDFLLGAPSFDGAAGGEPAFFAPVEMHGAAQSLPSPTVSEERRLMNSGDVHIGEGRWQNFFTDNIRPLNVWHTLWKTEPAHDFTVTKRNHFFQVDPDSPLAVFLWHTRLDMKRDIPNNGVLVGVLSSRKDNRWALAGSDGSNATRAWDEAAGTSSPLKVPFGKGAYAALLDSPLGGEAVFSLSDGLEATLDPAHRSSINITLDAAHSPQRRGQSGEADLLLLGIPRLTDTTRELATDSLATVRRFASDFGLLNGKAGYRLQTEAGQVVSQRYILDVNGRQTNCFSGQLSGRLISSLPITVSGLNDNWSCYLYDRTLKKARPIGVFESKGWATVLLKDNLNLFLGHPVTAADARLFIQVAQTGENRWRVEIHNPTTAPITTTILKNPYFDPLRTVQFSTEKVTVPAGSSIFRDL